MTGSSHQGSVNERIKDYDDIYNISSKESSYSKNLLSKAIRSNADLLKLEALDDVSQPPTESSLKF